MMTQTQIGDSLSELGWGIGLCDYQGCTLNSHVKNTTLREEGAIGCSAYHENNTYPLMKILLVTWLYVSLGAHQGLAI